MKYLSFLLLCLISFTANGKTPMSISDLKEGDSICFQLTVPTRILEKHQSWDFDQVHKVDFTLRVVNAREERIKFRLLPTAWYLCHGKRKTTQGKNKQLVELRTYYDSRYLGTYWDLKSPFFPFHERPTTVSVLVTNGEAEIDMNNAPNTREDGRLNKSNWYRNAQEMPRGLEITAYNTTLPDAELAFEQLIQQALPTFFARWTENARKGEPIPWMNQLFEGEQAAADRPSYLVVTGASFNLPANTYISFKSGGRAYLSLLGERIEAVAKTEQGTHFELFLSSPERLQFNDSFIDLTPGDSLLISRKDKESYVFSGKGSAHSAYTQAMIATCHRLRIETGDETAVTRYMKELERSMQEVLAEYSGEMNSYWLKSAELAIDYRYVSERLRLHNQLKQQNVGDRIQELPEGFWTSRQVINLFPHSDHQYQAFYYGELMEHFCTYKALQIQYSSLVSFSGFTSGPSKYHFANSIFWGYPRYCLTGNALKENMLRFHLRDMKGEYDNFIARCGNPRQREPIVRLNEQLAKAAPGANLKDLQLLIEPYLPLKEKPDGYIALLMKDKANENPNDLSFEERLAGIKDCKTDKTIHWCILVRESEKQVFNSWPEVQKQLKFIPDECFDDYQDKLLFGFENYLVLRNDGTIIYRDMSGIRNDAPQFIESAIQKDSFPQKEKAGTGWPWLLIIVSSLVSILITFLIVRRVLKQQEDRRRKILQLEIKAIRAQMNPHFTFNALASIQNLMAQKKEQEANDYLLNFAKLLRMVLSSSEKKFVSLAEEIDLLELYLSLEQLRYPFQYAIEVTSGIQTENEEIPGMLLQPIVENAIKHGIAPQGGGQLIVMFIKKGHTLYALIKDSGPGYHPTKESLQNGFGLRAVRERIDLLNKELKINISLEIENTDNEGPLNGCLVRISIPV